MKNDITVTFFSNFLLHHQTPFCEAMVKLIGDNYHYVATEKIPQERLDMGYRDLSKSASYAVNSYEDEASYNEAMRLGRESDVVIIGSAPDEFIVDRLKQNKLTFRYCERYFKQGRWRILDPRVFLCHYKMDIRYRNKNLRMLCASAYTAPDCRFIGSYLNKTYKWGYFPPLTLFDNIGEAIAKKHKNEILWVGRLIPLKHTEDALYAVKLLNENGYDFHLTIIGEGERKQYLQGLISKYNLRDKIDMLGFMSPEKVREYMENADIFLFTSDHNEGWGAVLNESMNSACAVVANREIGSVPYLIEHGKNGLIYDRHDKKSLFLNIKRLLDDEALKQSLQIEAYNTLATTWNADVAAQRLLDLIDCINSGREPKEKNGPCSKDY